MRGHLCDSTAFLFLVYALGLSRLSITEMRGTIHAAVMVYTCREPDRERTRRPEIFMTPIGLPLPASTSTNTFNNNTYGDDSVYMNNSMNNIQACDDDSHIYSNLQQARSHAAGPVGGTDDVSYQSSAIYQSAPGDKGYKPQVAPSHNVTRPNRHRIINKVRNSLMPRDN